MLFGNGEESWSCLPVAASLDVGDTSTRPNLLGNILSFTFDRCLHTLFFQNLSHIPRFRGLASLSVTREHFVAAALASGSDDFAEFPLAYARTGTLGASHGTVSCRRQFWRHDLYSPTSGILNLGSAVSEAQTANTTFGLILGHCSTR